MFQFLHGTIDSSMTLRLSATDVCFNSFMVRLIVGERLVKSEVQDEFQFLHGTIDSAAMLGKSRVAVGFNSFMVRLIVN